MGATGSEPGDYAGCRYAGVTHTHPPICLPPSLPSCADPEDPLTVTDETRSLGLLVSTSPSA